MPVRRFSYFLTVLALLWGGCEIQSPGPGSALGPPPRPQTQPPAGEAPGISDPQRPRYHFLPARNWMNDPNGLIQVGETYHLFYQHNPSGPLWGNMTWGHATSTDLVHWTHQALAIHPDRPYDKSGVFSGCIVLDGPVATAVYTGTNPGESQCIATSRDLVTWTKPAENPVIARPPPELGEVTGFRDPCVWKDGAGWYMALGSGTGAGGGLVLLYSSPDLRRWTYRGPLFSGDRFSDMWECPNFFKLDGEWALIVAANGRTVAYAGAFADGRFTPRSREFFDDGGSLYAPQAFLDSRGRRVLLGWLRERRSDGAQRAAGWSGVQSLPRVLNLDSEGRLVARPAEEVDSLRVRLVPGPTGPVRGEIPVDLRDTPGDCCEVAVTIDPGAATVFGMKVRQSRFSLEETVVSVDFVTGELALDTGRSSLDPAVARERRTCKVRVEPGRALTLRVFLDASVVEVFAQDQVCLTGRVYPTRPDAQAISLFSDGAGVRSCDLWEMTAIWPAAR